MDLTADWGWRRMTHLEEGECPVDEGQEDFLVHVDVEHSECCGHQVHVCRPMHSNQSFYRFYL